MAERSLLDTNPLVSVVIPCHNAASFIRDALDSALGQNYQHLEVIVVDNGSTDDTLTVLEDYATKFENILTITTEPEPGPSAARNKGLLLAKGSWIQFLDADDLIQPNKISHQIDLIRKNPHASLVVASYFYQFYNGRRELRSPNPDPFKALFTTSLGQTCSNLFSKSSLDRVNGWNPKLYFGEDYQLYFDLLINHAKVLYDYEPLTIVRRRISGNLSLTNWEHLIEKKWDLQIEWIAKLKLHNPDWYSKNKPFLDDAIYSTILSIGTQNASKAIVLFHQHFPTGFNPTQSSESQIPKIQGLIIQLMGTTLYIRLRQFLKASLQFFLPGIYRKYINKKW